MIPIQDLLHKIKWDPKENPEDYLLLYYDRVEDTLKEIKYNDIKDISERFLLVKINNKEVDIPLHRIKKVVKKGKIVWERG